MSAEPKLAVDWQDILDQTADLVIITDLDKRIISVNRAAERLLGYRREELVGTLIEDYYVDPAERRRLVAVAMDGGDVSSVSTQLRNKCGDIVDINLTLTVLKDDHGAVVGTVGISKDVTAATLLREQRLIMHRVSQKLLAATFLAAHGADQASADPPARATWEHIQRLLSDCNELIKEAAGVQPPECKAS